MTNMRRLLKTPTLRLEDGGGWQARTDLRNAQTGASSIVDSQSRTDARAQVARMTAPVLVPQSPGMDRAGFLARNPNVAASYAGTGRGIVNPSMPPGVSSPMAAPALRSTNTYTSAPAPTAPVPGGPITRVGNSFSNYSAPNQDPLYAKPGLDPNHAGNQSAFDKIRPMALPEDAGSNAFKLSLRHGGGGTLRTGHGGHVPGSGSGDKIPAKYEPGEFVVSNDMLDAAPGLREQLHGLRGNVLAAKGMTPEQADAKAVSGGTLRAAGGYGWPSADDLDLRNNSGPQPLPAASVTANKIVAAANPSSMTREQLFATRQAVPPQGAPKGPMPWAQQTPGNMPTPASTITNAQQSALYAAGDATAAARGAVPPLRQGIIGSTMKSAAGGLAKGLAFGAAGYGAAQSMADIGKNSAPGTNIDTRANVNAIPTGGNAPAPAAQPYSFWSDTEAGRNIGNAASALGAFGAGVNTMRAGATAAKLIGAGTALAGGMGAGAHAQAGEAPAQPQGPDLSQYTHTAGDATMPGQDPGRPSLREQVPAAQPQATAPQDPGPTGRDVMAMNNRLADSMAAERLAQEAAARTEAGPRHSGNDWQIRTNLRNMGVSAGSILGSRKEREARLAAYHQAQANDAAVMSGIDPASIAQIKARSDKAGYQATVHGQDIAARTSRENNRDTNATALRGHELDYAGRMAPAKLAAANRETIMKVMANESIGNDPARGAAYLTSVGRPDLAEPLQKQADATMKMASESDALVNNKWKDMQDQFKGQYMNPDKNGTPEANAGLESRAFARLKRTNPTAYNLDPVKRSEAIRSAIADEELMGAFGNPQGTGFASLVPSFISANRLDDRTNEIPSDGKLRGTTISDRVGGLRGALTPNLEEGDYMLRTPSGRQTMNLGKLSADAKERLQYHIDQSNKTK